MPPTYYVFECACCLDPYESALRKRHPPIPLRKRCDECVRICGHHGGSEPECRRRRKVQRWHHPYGEGQP